MKKIKVFLVIGIVLFCVGMVLVLNSENIGRYIIDGMVGRQETLFYSEERLNIMLAAKISNFRTIGVALMCLGGASSFWSATKILSK